MATIRSVRKTDPTFFKLVKPAPFVVTSLIWVFLGYGCFNPNAFPHEILGPIGRFYNYIVFENPTYVQRGFYGLLFIHFLESLYTLQLASTRGVSDFTTQVKWFIQTMIFGLSSWKPLKAYKPKSSD